MMDITLRVNGVTRTGSAEARKTLADFLRDDLDLTGTHVGCEHGVCGACTVIVDGRPVRSCLMLAVQADGKRIDTIEGLSDSGAISDLQAAFAERNAAQCGFCTPGMLLTAHEMLRKGGIETREDIRAFIAGNLCRCTGYEPIVDAIETVLRRRTQR